MFFSDKKNKCNQVENWLKELNANYELINIDTQKGKKIGNDWAVTKRNVPYLFYMTNDLRKTYYSDSVLKEKNSIKEKIKSIRNIEGE